MNRNLLDVIAASELLGGIAVLAGYAVVPLTGFAFHPAWLAAPGIAFGGLAMGAGIALFRKQRWGVPASMAVQVLQLASVSVASHFRYVAFAGPVAQLIIATTGVRLNVGGGGAFTAIPWSQDGSLGAIGANLEGGVGFQPGTLAESEFTLAINFVAIYFLWHLSAKSDEKTQAAPVEPIAPAG